MNTSSSGGGDSKQNSAKENQTSGPAPMEGPQPCSFKLRKLGTPLNSLPPIFLCIKEMGVHGPAKGGWGHWYTELDGQEVLTRVFAVKEQAISTCV